MRWLTDSWYGLLPPTWNVAVLVLASLFCGLLVGIDLERKHKAVGVRTLVLVSLGATVFTMVSGALEHRTPIAGQIISGIGFLGAGVILRGPFGVTGLASAATIWTTAAVGMTIGIGYAGAALVFSVFLLAVLTLIAAWEQHRLGMGDELELLIKFRTRGGKTRIKIEQALEEFRIPRDQYRLTTVEEESPVGALPSQSQISLRYSNVHHHHYEFLAYLAGIEDIEEIRREGVDPPVSQRKAGAR